MKTFIFSIVFLIFSTTGTVFAQSTYVLPYPGTMPGNKLYKLVLLKDTFDSFWYYGSIGQFRFHLSQADRYLVEAKTLFEYKQYLLAVYALKKSDTYFSSAGPFLDTARKEGKDISEKNTLYRDAAEKHKEVLSKLQFELPKHFTWSPEQGEPVVLPLQLNLSTSITVREAAL